MKKILKDKNYSLSQKYKSNINAVSTNIKNNINKCMSINLKMYAINIFICKYNKPERRNKKQFKRNDPITIR